MMSILKKQNNKNRTNRFFSAWASWVLRLRWPVLVLSLAISILSTITIARDLKLENAVEKVVATDSDVRRVVTELRSIFGMDALFQVLVQGDVFTPNFLEKLKGFHEELATIDLPLESLSNPLDGSLEAIVPDKNDNLDPKLDFDDFGENGQAGDGWADEEGGAVFENVTSLINARVTSWKNGTMSVGGLLDNWPETPSMDDLKQRVLSDRTMVGRVVGSKGHSAVIILQSARITEEEAIRVYDEMKRIASRYNGEDFIIQIAGMPSLGVALTKTMISDLWRTIFICCVALILIVSYIFRHWIGVLGPLAVVNQGILWTLGLMAWTGIPLTIVTSILPGFVLCVGIGDAIHIQSVYRDFRRLGVPNDQAIIKAIGNTGVPVLLTTLTTCVGLLSFRLATLHTVRQLGTFGAVGVFMALLLSLAFLPAVLSFNKTNLLGTTKASKGADYLDRLLGLFNRLTAPQIASGTTHKSYGRARIVLVLAAGLALVAIYGASRLGISYDPITWLPRDNETRLAFESIDENVGGTSSVALLIEAPPGKDIRDREFLLALEKLEHHIESYRDPQDGRAIVGKSISILDLVRETSQALHDNNPQFYKIPETQQGAVDMFTAFENASPSELKSLATVDMTKSVFYVPVKWMDAWKYRPLTEHISKGIDKYIGQKATIKVTGSVYTVLVIVNSLVSDLMRSFGTALIIITLMMLLLLKDLKLGLIAMVPNILPIITVMGIMKLVDIPLDVVTLLVGSVGIGVAVDDTIHFLYQFQHYQKQYGDVNLSIEKAMSHTGRAMVTTSLILVMGHSVFILASMSHIVTFGMLMILIVSAALLMDLTLIPALVRFIYADRVVQKTASQREHAVCNSNQYETNAHV